jgi:hypothetical protein
MRSPFHSPKLVRFIAVILLIIIFVQVLPAMMIFTGATPQQAVEAKGQHMAPVMNAAGVWEYMKLAFALILIALIGRIWFLLERIAARLERNKLDVNLTMKKDF